MGNLYLWIQLLTSRTIFEGLPTWIVKWRYQLLPHSGLPSHVLTDHVVHMLWPGLCADRFPNSLVLVGNETRGRSKRSPGLLQPDRVRVHEVETVLLVLIKLAIRSSVTHLRLKRELDKWRKGSSYSIFSGLVTLYRSIHLSLRSQ